jgi:hypothetical protein
MQMASTIPSNKQLPVDAGNRSGGHPSRLLFRLFPTITGGRRVLLFVDARTTQARGVKRSTT